MATDADPSTAVNLSDSWGPPLAAVFVSLVLYGVSILQTFLYYERYAADSTILKSLVAWVFVLDTTHVVLISAGVWQPFILHFGDDNFVAHTHAPLLIATVVTSVVSSTVQSFFIYRIWFMIKSRFKFGWVFPAILMPIVASQLVLGVFYTVTAMVFQTSVSAVSGPLLTKVALALNGLATGIDVTITISLCMLLAMGQTGLESTDRMLHRLIFVTVNTGLCSALFAFLAFILLIVYPTNLTFLALYFPLCTVYCNTLLASLNARAFIRGSDEMRRPNLVSTLVWHHHSSDDAASVQAAEA